MSEPSTHHPRASAHPPRHATGPADGVARQSSRPPDELAGLTALSAGRPDGLAGPGAARRPPLAARRKGMDGVRRPGTGSRARVILPCASAGEVPEVVVLVPEGRRAVATGGAHGRRPERNPWTTAGHVLSAPAGRRSSRSIAGASSYEPFLCSAGAGEKMNDALHALRWLEDSLAPPVATTLDTSEAQRHGPARVDHGPARAGGVHAFSGEVPPPTHRHAPLADQHAASGEGVRHG